MSATEELHLLVDHIPAGDRETVRAMLRGLLDPVDRAILSAQPDDEPDTEEERALVAASFADSEPDVPFELVDWDNL